EGAGQALGPHQRREAGAEVDGAAPVGGQQVGVAPDAGRAGGDLLPGHRGADGVVVVGRLERAEAPLADVERRHLVGAPAFPALELGYVRHGLSLSSRRALERLEREFRSSAAHRSGIGTWRFPRRSPGWHWLPRRQRACPSAALDERVLAASRLTGRRPDRQSAPAGRQVPDSGPMHAAGPVFSHRDFDRRRLAARKEEAGLTVSLCIPARDEAATIGRIVEIARRHLAEDVPLLDEILVVDDHSSDHTADAARSAGAKVVHSAEVLPAAGPGSGKGDAIWKSLSASTGDLVAWVDGDITDFGPRFLTGLLGPLLTYPSVEFVKGFYRRPGGGPAGGG